jgi:integrase/recombinase XerD
VFVAVASGHILVRHRVCVNVSARLSRAISDAKSHLWAASSGLLPVEHSEEPIMLRFRSIIHESDIIMAQASVLTDNEIRRVFRIIETTRHAGRNRLAFVLSVYAGLRVGEIAALTTGDVATQGGEARREIKLGAHQTKGSKGRTVVLSNRVRTEIDAHLKGRANHHHGAPLIASQRNGRPFSNVSLSMLFKEIYEAAGIRTSSHSGRRTFATRLNAKGVGMRTIQKLMGHRHIGTTALYCDVSEDTLRNAVELV